MKCPYCKEVIVSLDYVERGYCNTDGQDRNPDESVFKCPDCECVVDTFDSGAANALTE